MADVLLAHSFFLKNDPKQVAKMRPYAPLGTLYAAAQLRQEGRAVALFDAMLAAGEEELAAALDEHRPRFFVLYEDSFNFLNKMCLEHTRAAACRMSRRARESGAIVLAAGADVTDHPRTYLDHGVQYALLGEADHTLRELIAALAAGRPAAEIPGVAVADPSAANGFRQSAARTFERHPDVFPLPAWDLVDAERYRAAWRRAHGYYSVNLVTTRGCPFHCNWCAKPIWGRRYAMRSPGNVADEMALVQRVLAPDHVWFADDIFGLQPRWVADFGREVEFRGVRIPFTIQSRADLMTDVAVAGLSRAGCAEVWLGAESGSQKVLDAMDKGIRVEEVVAATRRLQAAGIRACWFLQFGYPGETWDDILATVTLVRESLPDDVGVSVSYPLPGTKFFDMVQAELGEKTRWQDSNDLAMMFQGTYQTPFYRQLRQVVHREVELRRAGTADAAALRGLRDDWRELEKLEQACRSAAPTAVHKPYDSLPAPDLSRPWN